MATAARPLPAPGPALRQPSSTFVHATLPTISRCSKLQPFHVISSKGRSPEEAGAVRKSSMRELSRILRREAAIRGISRKANAAVIKSGHLWPRAVLEALDEAVSCRQWESALKIFKLLRKQFWYIPKCQTYARLITTLGKCGQPEQARSLFQTMLSEGLQPTLDVYTSLVGAYGLSGHFEKAFQLIDEMKSVSDCKPDVYTYTILINSCCKLQRFDLISKILNDMSYVDVCCTNVTYNTIIDGYGKAGLHEQMEEVLSDMVESDYCDPDVVTMNSFLWAYGNIGQIQKMEIWYEEFQHMGVAPDVMSFNILIRSYGKADKFDKMASVVEFMQKRFFSPTVVTYNTIIESYGKVTNIEKMEEIFRLMKNQGMKPNFVTYCSLVSAYAKAGLLDRISLILKQVVNSDVLLDTTFFNCVISAYGQARDVDSAEEIYLSMKKWNCKPDNITYAILIQLYRGQGMIEAAQKLESKMSGTFSQGTIYSNLVPADKERMN